MRNLLLVLTLTSPAAAQDGMTGAEFDAYVTGRTITFRTDLNPSSINHPSAIAKSNISIFRDRIR